MNSNKTLSQRIDATIDMGHDLYDWVVDRRPMAIVVDDDVASRLDVQLQRTYHKLEGLMFEALSAAADRISQAVAFEYLDDAPMLVARRGSVTGMLCG